MGMGGGTSVPTIIDIVLSLDEETKGIMMNEKVYERLVPEKALKQMQQKVTKVYSLYGVYEKINEEERRFEEYHLTGKPLNAQIITYRLKEFYYGGGLAPTGIAPVIA